MAKKIHATQDWVKTEISNLTDAAPETLDTLKELAAALGNDKDFATTMIKKLDKKADKNELMNVANVLKGEVFGKVLNINDVSPIEHDIEIKVVSNNILPYPYFWNTKTNSGISYTVNNDGSITVDGTSSAFSVFYLTNDKGSINDLFEDGMTYTIGTMPTNISLTVVAYDKENNTNKYYYKGNRNTTFTVNKNKYDYKWMQIQIDANKTFENVTIYPQVVLGKVSTLYTPYVSNANTTPVTIQDANGTVSTYTPDTTGCIKGINSVYPHMTIKSSEDNVLVICKYNRDINSIDKNLENLKILHQNKLRDIYRAKALGGEVDDDVALQKYIDDETYVYIPQGTYRLKKPLVIRKAGTVLQGEGYGFKTLLVPENTNVVHKIYKDDVEVDSIKTLVYVAPQSGNSMMFTIRDICFRAYTSHEDKTIPNENYDGSCIASNVYIIDSKIENCWFNGGASPIDGETVGKLENSDIEVKQYYENSKTRINSTAISLNAMHTIISGCWFECFDTAINLGKYGDPTKNNRNSNGYLITNCDFWCNLNAVNATGRGAIRSCHFSSMQGGYAVRAYNGGFVNLSDCTAWTDRHIDDNKKKNEREYPFPLNKNPLLFVNDGEGKMIIVENNSLLTVNGLSVNDVLKEDSAYNKIFCARGNKNNATLKISDCDLYEGGINKVECVSSSIEDNLYQQIITEIDVEKMSDIKKLESTSPNCYFELEFENIPENIICAIGSKIYFTNPSTNIGAVYTDAGWDYFGADDELNIDDIKDLIKNKVDKAEIELFNKYGTTNIYVLQKGVDYITDESGTVITGTSEGQIIDKSGYTIVIPEGITKISINDYDVSSKKYIIADKIMLPSTFKEIESNAIAINEVVLSEGITSFSTTDFGFSGNLYLPKSLVSLDLFDFNGNIYCNELSTKIYCTVNIGDYNLYCPLSINTIDGGASNSLYIYNPNVEFINFRANTIYGYAGSTAEKHAKEIECTFVNIGSNYSEEIKELKNYELPNDVVRDANYVHTDNNFTTEEKNKLAELTSGNNMNISQDITRIENELNNKADLIDGKVPASQLPSYVDDVIEGKRVSDTSFTVNNVEIKAESGKIYLDIDTNIQYRWSGSKYAEISSSIALGETENTAYSGAKGKKNAEDIEDLKINVEKLENKIDMLNTNTYVYVLQEGVDYITDETGTQIVNSVDGKALDYMGQTVTVPEGITSIKDTSPVSYENQRYIINCDTFICPSSLKEIGVSAVNSRKFILNDNIETIELDIETTDYPQPVEIELTNSSTRLHAYDIRGGNITAPINIEKIDIHFQYFQGSIYVYNPKATINCLIEFDDVLDKTQIKIHGYAGSTAEAFAEEHGYAFITIENIESDYTDELNFKLYGTRDVYTLTENDINIDSNGCFCSQKYEEIVHDVIIIPEGVIKIKPMALGYDEDTFVDWSEGEYTINLRSKKTICPSTLKDIESACRLSSDDYTMIRCLGDNVILNNGLEYLELGTVVQFNAGIGDLILPNTVKTLKTREIMETIVLPKDMETINLVLDTVYKGGKLYVHNSTMDFSNVEYWEQEDSEFTIYGYLGSTAHNFAKEHNIKFIDIENECSVILNGLNTTNVIIRPNEYYTFTEIDSLTVELDTTSDYKLDEFMFSFETHETADNSFLQIISDEEIKWVKDLNIKPNYIYEVSIINNVGVIVGITKGVV